MRHQILTLSLYKGFSHCKCQHKILQQPEEVAKTTENVYDVTHTFSVFLLYYKKRGSSKNSKQNEINCDDKLTLEKFTRDLLL